MTSLAAAAADEAADVMLVDDTPENLQVLSAMLKERGHRVRPVRDGKRALEAARMQTPDLVLLDINMPEMNGYEVCREFKADERLREVPIIFISARNDVLDKVKAFEFGGVDYVTKPFQLEEVHSRVANHLKLRRQTRELERSYARLAELETLRDSLVHMVVHDMRSPLTALIANLGFVKEDIEETLDDQAREDIVEALAAARRLNGMANDLLDVSRLEAGRMPIAVTECDLAAVIAAAIANVRGMASNVEVQVDVPTPLLVRCDDRVIGRVVENLVSNGLKHSRQGHTLNVGADRRDAEVRLSIRDQGPGIPQAYREKIFEKFGMAEERQEHRYHSVGLGLAFCKLAVEAHGGCIGVDSEEGKGSTFWVTLPISLEQYAEPAGEGAGR